MNFPLQGLFYFLDGFVLITKPGLRRFVLFPLLINIFLFIGLFFLFSYFVTEFNIWFEQFLPAWLAWVSFIIWILFFLSFFLIFIYTFVTIANLIAAPFNSLLAEKVELYLTGKTLEQRSLFENVKDVPRMMGRQFAIIVYYLPRALLFLILFFVPVIQAGAAIFWFIFNGWFMSLTYLDYPTDNHRISFQALREWTGQHRVLSIGFGVSVLIATMIPILNFFIMPAAVAGATKLWVENNKGDK